MSTSKPHGRPGVPPASQAPQGNPSGQGATNPYARFIPREELGNFSAWAPQTFEARPAGQPDVGVRKPTLAERAGADDEVVVAALCHDIGKAISVPNHPEIAAAILKPYVRREVHFMIAAHQDFQGRHYYHHFGMDPDARSQHAGSPYFDLAQRFADGAVSLSRQRAHRRR